MAKVKRPVIVWALGLYGLFGSAVTTLMGLIILFDENRVDDFAALNATNEALLWYGGFAVAIGLFGVYLASSILSGQKWARLWYTVVGTLNIVGGLWQILHHTGDERWAGVTVLVLWVITIYLLYSEKSDKYFADYEEKN